MVYLDTHVAVWLYAGRLNKLTEPVKQYLRTNPVLISPMVRLEMAYLHRLNRTDADADTMIADLAQRIGLRICPKPFNTIVGQAVGISWTRDPFDRIIVAHANVNADTLLTADQQIRNNYAYAVW